MRPRLPVLAGAATGLAAAMLVLGYAAVRHRQANSPMLSDFGGPVRTVVMQFSLGSDSVGPVFRDYLKWQSPDVTAYVVCPEKADFDALCALIGPVHCRIVPVYVHHPCTAWSRDRWVALGEGSGPVTLLAQKGELGQESWPMRAGDSIVAADLAREVPGEFAFRRSALFFDGGDYLADGPYVFATRGMLERNLQHTVTTRENLLEAIGRDTGLSPVLMDAGPTHHAGMFMMCAGPDASGTRVMVVADPSLGKQHFAASEQADAQFTGGPDFSQQAQHAYDAVAALCAEKGYRVVRIPIVPAAQGKMYLTYVNVILDQTPEGRKIVYMSTYAGQQALNEAAAEVWRGIGYEVRPIDVTSVWQMGGTLHCLVNVCRRGRAGAAAREYEPWRK